MSARAEPVAYADDRTHYLHTAEPQHGIPGFEWHHIKAGQAEIALVRWHDRVYNAAASVLNIEHGQFSVRVDLTAEQLRVMAYAMLQCATDLDTAARAAQPCDSTAAHPAELSTLERQAWALPTLREVTA